MDKEKFKPLSVQAFCGVLLILWCCILSAHAAVDAALYQGEAPVASYSQADWQKAIVPALQQVLIKISGDPKVTQNQVVRKALTKPESLVQSYNYVAGSEQKPLTLMVRFSPKAMDALLQKADLPDATAVNTPVVADNPPATDSSTPPQKINIVVSQVNSLQDYTALLDYLRHLDGVADVNSKQTKGDRVLLIVKITQPVAGLIQAIAKDNKLVKSTANTGNVNAEVLQYRWMAGAGATATTETTTPVAASTAATMTPPPPPSSGAAPIVEGVPTILSGTHTGSNGTAATPSDSEQAQSFAAPSADNNFVPEGGVSP